MVSTKKGEDLLSFTLKFRSLSTAYLLPVTEWELSDIKRPTLRRYLFFLTKARRKHFTTMSYEHLRPATTSTRWIILKKPIE
jgi:hypothetical protein